MAISWKGQNNSISCSIILVPVYLGNLIITIFLARIELLTTFQSLKSSTKIIPFPVSIILFPAEFKNQIITICLARKELLTNFQSQKSWYGCGRGGVKLCRRYLLFACSKIWINTQRAAWGQNSVLVIFGDNGSLNHMKSNQRM